MDAMLHSTHYIYSKAGSFLGTTPSVAALSIEKHKNGSNGSRYCPCVVSPDNVFAQPYCGTFVDATVHSAG